ncbi:hypothetical protein GV828_04155 [Flavobacterium sp. NST-5]|uniref:Uncharacterized protein n=1 Tax=Flavobacterium ichthyis TaxID=2698827 RepID=A0ABW9Z6W2_9FLAO|nr:hypothetical protein [Flavobacterium ichthyis]NBL64394.1 hypothetical protein [Flavobacterium ichthyis]
MKKLMTVLFFLVFNMMAFAQNANDLAKSDVEALKQEITITKQAEETFLELFKSKHEALSKSGTSEAKKKIIHKSVDAKLRGTLSADQMAKLDAKPELLKKLTQK